MRQLKLALLAATLCAAMGTMGCRTTTVQQGAVIGGALGAGTGAIIGHQQGKQGEGALIGAGAGALAGALIGDQVDERRPRPSSRTVKAPATTMQRGHYETRIVMSPSGERYEERIWVQSR
ncbi:MAG: glycine zipper 2TM domain-containing protein [bacterium]|nr:glycine zipper 2TM domain-containing protein [bacterium]